jgi:hypothetical protein
LCPLHSQVRVNTFASASVENLTKEAKNDAGMADHPLVRWGMNCIYFQLATRKQSR